MNIYTLKVKSNVDSNIYIDDHFKTIAKKDQLVMISLEEGDYWVRAENVNNPDNVITQIVSLNQHKILELKFAERTISQDRSDAKSHEQALTYTNDSLAHKKQVSSEHSAKINEVVELLIVNAEDKISDKRPKGKREEHKTVKEVNVTNTSVSNGDSYDIPNILWRILLTIGLFAIVIALIPTVVGAPVSIMIAKPGFDSIWKGDCDLF